MANVLNVKLAQSLYRVSVDIIIITTHRVGVLWSVFTNLSSCERAPLGFSSSKISLLLFSCRMRVDVSAVAMTDGDNDYNMISFSMLTSYHGDCTVPGLFIITTVEVT